MKRYSIFSLLFCLCFHLYSQDFITLNYLKTAEDSLDMDFFPAKSASGRKVPLVIFVHGGGFSGGKRSDGRALGRYLAAHGVATASISYTLYMKGKDFGCQGVLTEKVKAFRYGVTDLWEATKFMLQQAGKYNVDTQKIFIAGSSAGAETVLHAPYWNADMAVFGSGLPAGFRYAGIIAGAGAIMDLNLINRNNLIPTMLFQGDNDPTVPYGQAAHHFCNCADPGWLMLFGSLPLYRHINELKGSVILYSFIGGNHSFAGAYFNKNQSFVLQFIQKVIDGKKMSKHIKIKPSATE